MQPSLSSGGLRWRDIDFDRATLQIAQVVQKTRDGLTMKEPKTRRSRRTISLSPTLVAELRLRKRLLAETRLRLGLGRDPRDLVFPSSNGGIRDPDVVTKQFSREIAAANLPRVTLHGLRHTHITDLLRRGIPVHVVSGRAVMQTRQ